MKIAFKSFYCLGSFSYQMFFFFDFPLKDYTWDGCGMAVGAGLVGVWVDPNSQFLASSSALSPIILALSLSSYTKLSYI
jgi:hypothetical protein